MIRSLSTIYANGHQNMPRWVRVLRLVRMKW
nr:MAG TPA: hypothetical protein [Caudoviricetes sp.]